MLLYERNKKNCLIYFNSVINKNEVTKEQASLIDFNKFFFLINNYNKFKKD